MTITTTSHAFAAGDIDYINNLNNVRNDIGSLTTDANAKGTMSTQNANAVAITGGTLGGVTITNSSVSANDGASGSIFTTVQGFITKILSSTGSTIVGFTQNLTGAVARTVQDKLSDTVHAKDFPGGTWDGVADDSAAWILALASGARRVDFSGLTTKLTSTIDLNSNQTLILTGTKIIVSGSSFTALRALAKTNFNLVGPFEIVGDGATVGTSIGIYLSDCSRFKILNPDISQIRGWGIFIDGGSNTSSRDNHGTIENPKIRDCYYGWEDQAGTGAEYISVLNPQITKCTIWNVKTSAGNINWTGGSIIDGGQDGVIVAAGNNHAHGIFNGVNISHNVRYNVYTQQVLNGQSFADCHIYANNAAGQGAIFLDRSKGIYFDGGHLDAWVYNDKDGSSGQNVIRNMYCPGSYGDVKLLGGPNPGKDQLVFESCYGAGAYTAGITINCPSPVYALVSTNGPQSMTSGVSADLKFTTKTFDRRNAYNTGTGVFTVPASQSGIYRINFNLAFSGTAMDASLSYAELKRNGIPVLISSMAIYSTTLLSSDFSTDIYLDAADTIKISASIVGTAPAFGNNTYLSVLSILRIA